MVSQYGGSGVDIEVQVGPGAQGVGGGPHLGVRGQGQGARGQGTVPQIGGV